jgi:hypothetical protein
MIVVFKCPIQTCTVQFSEEWPFSYTNGHFLQGRVVTCPAYGLRHAGLPLGSLHPPQPATAIIISATCAVGGCGLEDAD